MNYLNLKELSKLCQNCKLPAYIFLINFPSLEQLDWISTMPVLKATSDFQHEVCRLLILFPPPGTEKNNHLLLDVFAENMMNTMVKTMPALPCWFRRQYLKHTIASLYLDVKYIIITEKLMFISSLKQKHIAKAAIIPCMKRKSLFSTSPTLSSRNKHMIQLSFIWITESN